MNEYYILSSGQLNLLQHNEVVENAETVRWNNNGTKFVCKTKIGIVDAPFMIPQKKFLHNEILIELTKPEWASEV
jgi:hypothetical protein